MKLLPRPKHIQEKEGFFYISYATKIVDTTALRMTKQNQIFQKKIKEILGYHLLMIKGASMGKDIFLEEVKGLLEQEYYLRVTEEGILIQGSSKVAIFYGMQTLMQIFQIYGGVLPCVEIHDLPEIENRGYYLDVTRGKVFKVEYLKKFIDKLASYKINQFQLYIEHTYMFQGMSELWRDETPFTSEEILELVEYCGDRCIELVPSLSSFGHLYMLLRIKKYSELCELENSHGKEFSYWDRMQHHTINPLDERAIKLVQTMLKEYMALFQSDKFNICCDETFDLGKGRSKAVADEIGVHKVYINYVKEICDFMVKQGKQPMFWGDVICNEPELIKELPAETICLTWGYGKDQREEESRLMAKANAVQYLCPGVSGWNQWINLFEDSYQNIKLMCGYARKYNAIGILNTDWGDFGHINQLEYSYPGMIYGASFTWNKEDISFEEINQEISKLEYGDTTGTLVSLLAKTSEDSIFPWWHAVVHYEISKGLHMRTNEPTIEEVIKADGKKANERLTQNLKDIKFLLSTCDRTKRELFHIYEITISGIMIWNLIGHQLVNFDGNGEEIASALEEWFMEYKKLWRAASKEGDLKHVAEVVFWYADLLRN